MRQWVHAWLLPLLLSPFSPEIMETELSSDIFRHDHPSLGARPERVTARNGAVAADDNRCSEIGRDVLRDGGNAVDAAVATAFCLGVVSPASSGIGGGAFILIRLADGSSYAYDSREVAPRAAHKNMYGGDAGKKTKGGLSVAVPGEVAGLYKAWKMHGSGKVAWRRLVTPAEQLARKGFTVSLYLSNQIRIAYDKVKQDAGLRQVFMPRGVLLKTGDTVVNLKLADTLKTISESGVSGFYAGAVARGLVSDVKRLGGILTLEDLESYQVRTRDPIVTHFHELGLQLIGMPPPSAGGAATVLILNILKKYISIRGPLGVHRFVEALKHAFAMRMDLGDPDFSPDVDKVVDEMLSPRVAAKLKARIYDNQTFDPAYYGAKGMSYNIVDHGTTHLSVVDKERNAVALTSSTNSYFGSGIMSLSTGIIVNNQMDDFDIPGINPPKLANYIEPGKRPLSSLSPTIILKGGELSGVLGASGGAKTFAGTIQVILNSYIKGMGPMNSVLAPRVYHTLYPNEVRYEKWNTVSGDLIEVAQNVTAGLKRRKHELKPLRGQGAITQFIQAQTTKTGKQVLVAVSDPRKGGLPAGY